MISGGRSNNTVEVCAPNCFKVWIGEKTVLFSYGMPVALWQRGNGEIKRFAIDKAPTPTTARHLNAHGPERFVQPGDHFEKVTFEQLDALINA